MPLDPLRVDILHIKLFINCRTIAARQKYCINGFTSIPPPGPSKVDFRFPDAISQIWMMPSKLPDASNCPSLLNAKLETESL
jgi:hypothetical protein